MYPNEAYKLFNREKFLMKLRIEGFHVEDNHVTYPLKEKPRKCLLDFAFAGEIVGDKYLIVNTSHKYGSCRACKEAISKLQKIARQFEN